jgi:hypothetical protein
VQVVRIVDKQGDGLLGALEQFLEVALDVQTAVSQSSGRQRLNIHGAIDLETGKTRMIEAATVNAISMILLLRAIEAMYPGKRLIRLFVDNAAIITRSWRRPG